MEKKDWKDTLLMANTDFKMKAGLPQKEQEFATFWRENKIYQKSLAKNKDNQDFILHDGPPYANGNLHVGHALNKILKDIIVRRKHMEGFYAPFVPGWDTHGLPIELKMLQELKMSKDDMDKVTLRKEAKKYALKQVENQKQQFATMQLFSDMKDIYVTLDPNFEANQLQLFKKMLLDGIVYKGLKPVYWSPSSESALAMSEVEYEDHRSPQIIVAFDVKEGNEFVKDDMSLLIMTTTPWTLIANSGVAVGKNINYSVVEVNGNKYILATNLLSSVAELSKWGDYKVINSFTGDKIAGIKYQRPIVNKTSPVVIGHHVEESSGTGLVHMAPLFGEDDYIIGKQENLEMIMHVDSKGHFNEEAGKYQGLFYENANKEIGMFLEENKKLLSLKFIKHSYPHDWRTHKPVIYRGVPQWFVNIEKIKPQIINALKDVKSTPEWGISRIEKMISSRTEWTISRQRTWGVPIIIFYDKEGKPVIKEEILDYVINLVKEHGSDIWWEKEADQLLPESYRNQGFTKEMDIMDVWFDSGSSSVGVNPGGKKAPFDLYLEGNDQYRGWFNSSLINSVAYRNKSPYKSLLSHGFVLDGKQQKMSKSKGNVIDPLKIINKNGADILRLWAANSEYTSDVSISDDILKQNIEIYRRLRNTFRFMLGNIDDFNYKPIELTGIHKHISNQISLYFNQVNKHFDNYKFIEIVKDTNKLFIDLSSWYFDYAKDILYCDHKDSKERRMIQSNISDILKKTMISMAPILPTTIEEVKKHFKNWQQFESIFLMRPNFSQIKLNQSEKFAKFISFYKPKANKILENARNEEKIKRTNEAILHMKINAEDIIGTELEYAKYLMVAKVIFDKEWKVEGFDSLKCQRCWNHFYSNELTKENICQRCDKVIQL